MMRSSVPPAKPKPNVNLSIPRGAQPPVRSYSPYAFEVHPPPSESDGSTPTLTKSRMTSPPSLVMSPSQDPIYRTVSHGDGTPSSSSSSVPRSHSQQSLGLYRDPSHPDPTPIHTFHVSRRVNAPSHRSSKSDLGPVPIPSSSTASSSSSSAYLVRHGSIGSSFNYEPANYPAEDDVESLSHFSRELSNLSLDSEEGLRRFQEGLLPEEDEEWHRLVPEGARDSLGKTEVQRQSVLFEIFKGERDYTRDLELVHEVFVEPLRTADPPVISPPERLRGFIGEIFWNLDQILAHHRRMLGALFERQREQHPLVQSVADIILDTSLAFRSDYESYIKHYPLAEARHRTELRRNKSYRHFISSRPSLSPNPALKKRDLVTFLSRPVTRLPRLSLILDALSKVTDPEHPDADSLPLIHSILSEFIRSTQPGIEAAEGKVKFWGFCESLVFQKGEILDLDLYDESRTLLLSGRLARRQRTETDWSGWNDYFVALLDNHLIFTREEQKQSGVLRRMVVSRPLPLSYVRLGSFTSPPESRKERADDGRLLESLRFQHRQMYPFTVYHASAKGNRRYTLYASGEKERGRWREALGDALAIHRAREESNMWFAPQVVVDGFFRYGGQSHANGEGSNVAAAAAMGEKEKDGGGKELRRETIGGGATGKVTAVAPFIYSGRKYVAVGCATGIYVSPQGGAAENASSWKRVLHYPNPSNVIALQDFNKLVVHSDGSLYSYPLDLLALLSHSQVGARDVDASMERVRTQNGSVLFVRAGRVGQRAMIVYASKKTLQVTLQALEVVHAAETSGLKRMSTGMGMGLGGKAKGGQSVSYRPFGEPFYVPKDAYDISPLVKTIAIATEKGVVVVDPTNLDNAIVTVVPDFSGAGSNNAPLNDLKGKCDAARALGLVRCEGSELLVVYDTIGCYITKHGVPSRNCGYIRWETPATTFAFRGPHLLLFSAQFVEVRNTSTGRLVQVIEGRDVRMMHCAAKDGSGDTIMVAMRGENGKGEGWSDKVVELVETAEIGAMSGVESAMWDEWDM